jgi:hypothetical protein
VGFVDKIRQLKESRNLPPLSIGAFGNKIKKDVNSNFMFSEMWQIKGIFPKLEIFSNSLNESAVFATCDTFTDLYKGGRKQSRLNYIAFYDEFVNKFKIME